MPVMVHHRTACFAPILIIITTIFLSYSNTFDATWHFDDVGNIHTNQALHLTDLKPASLLSTFFANPVFPNKKIFYRPISNLTIALNWYWGGDNVWGYHLLNISVHAFTALFLFLTVYNLYSTPSLAESNQKQVYNIALLSTLLWALNPMQTQAVTYVIQRMASLATMFYILALYLYLKGRLTPLIKSKALLFIGALTSSLLAMGSKENAVTLPACFVLIEVIFFKTIHSWRNKKKVLVFLFCGALLCTATLVLTHGDPFSFINGYAERSFTLKERILTEPRILVFYLSQLIYPAVFRLSLEHDVVLSTSLLTPWTTWASILFLLFLLYYATAHYRRQPLISFAIFFFFLNHLIESTILPVELLFEHRNYLPSLFLFVPLTDYLLRKLSFQSNGSLGKPWLQILSLSTMVVLFGTGTYLRNLDWKSEKSLWQDTLNKTPKSARAAYNLGNWHLESGQYDEALALFARAEKYSSTAPTPQYMRVLALNGTGSAQLFTGNAKEAAQSFETAVAIDPHYAVSRANLALAFVTQRKWDDADLQITKALEKEPNNIDYNFIYHIISLGSGHAEGNDHTFIQKFLSKRPKSANLLLLTSILYKENGQYEEAEKYIKKYLEIFRKDVPAELSLFEIKNYMDKSKEANDILNSLRSKGEYFHIMNAYKNNSLLGFPIFLKETINKNFPEIKIHADTDNHQ